MPAPTVLGVPLGLAPYLRTDKHVTDRHAVYRFYDDSENLLYIGMSKDWPYRLSQHRRSKYWFNDIARVVVEYHESRELALEAEKRAIQSERPQHNVTHNDPDLPRLPDLSTRMGAFMLHPGQYVALGMTGNRCPVGEVIQNDGTFVTLQLKDWLTGSYIGRRHCYRLKDIVEIVYADYDAKTVYDDHFADFQTRWLAA